MFLHVFAHIQGVQRVLIAKHKVGDGFGQQRFANAGWTKEQERTHWTLWIFQTRSTLANGAGHGLDGLLLTNNGLVKLRLQLKQSLAFFLGQTRQWNARHLAHNFRDHFLVHGSRGLVHAIAPALLQLLFFFAKFLGLITQVGGFFIVRVLHGVILVNAQALDASF